MLEEQKRLLWHAVVITVFYGTLRLLNRGQLTGLSLTLYSLSHNNPSDNGGHWLMIRRQIPTKASSEVPCDIMNSLMGCSRYEFRVTTRRVSWRSVRYLSRNVSCCRPPKAEGVPARTGHPSRHTGTALRRETEMERKIQVFHDVRYRRLVMHDLSSTLFFKRKRHRKDLHEKQLLWHGLVSLGNLFKRFFACNKIYFVIHY